MTNVAGEDVAMDDTLHTNGRSLLDFITHYEQHYPIFERLAPCLETKEILALAQTSKALRRVLYETQFDVNRRLRRFVQDPIALRSQLSKHEALISGSFVIQFFERVLWKDSDLDIYLEQKPGASEPGELVTYLCEKERYQYEHSYSIELNEPHYPLEIVQRVETYVRYNESNDSESKIQLVYMSTDPLQGILRCFYTTAVINFITWNRAYSIFPLLTYVQHQTHHLKPPKDLSSANWKRKYSDRGWARIDTDRARSDGPTQLVRRVGDRNTWKMDLDTTGVLPSELPETVFDYADFCLLSSWHYSTVHCSPFKSLVLRHSYLQWGPLTELTTLPTLLRLKFWDHFVRAKVDELAREQMLELGPRQRPHGFLLPGYGSVEGLYEGSFEKPKEWRFHDGEIEGWYREWEKAVEAKKKELPNWAFVSNAGFMTKDALTYYFRP